MSIAEFLLGDDPEHRVNGAVRVYPVGRNRVMTARLALLAPADGTEPRGVSIGTQGAARKCASCTSPSDLGGKYCKVHQAAAKAKQKVKRRILEQKRRRRVARG